MFSLRSSSERARPPKSLMLGGLAVLAVTSMAAIDVVPTREVGATTPKVENVDLRTWADDARAEVVAMDLAAAQAEAEAEAAAAAAEAEAAAAATSHWDRLADCESGQWNGQGVPVAGTANWSSTAGFFEGGLQFDPRTWDGFRDSDMPASAYDASREVQIEVAERVLDAQGWGAWPVCSIKVGLR